MPPAGVLGNNPTGFQGFLGAAKGQQTPFVKGDPKPLFEAHGKCSTFGPPGEAAGTTASGRSDSDAGIAMRLPLGQEHQLLGKPAVVQIQTGNGIKAGILPVIDWGPAAWTGRVLDVTGAGAKQIGIDPSNFPTGAQSNTWVFNSTQDAQAFAVNHNIAHAIDNSPGGAIGAAVGAGTDVIGGAVSGITGAISTLVGVFSFIFSMGFLYVIGGGLLLTLALVMIYHNMK